MSASETLLYPTKTLLSEHSLISILWRIFLLTSICSYLIYFLFFLTPFPFLSPHFVFAFLSSAHERFDDMGRACSANGGNEKYVQNFGWEA
jgi:hypothetical protein